METKRKGEIVTHQALALFDLIFSCLLAIFFNLFSSSRTFSPPAFISTFSHRSFSSFFSLCSGFNFSNLSFLAARTSNAAFGSLGKA